MLKLSENPPILWPENIDVTDIQGQWWVAHTKSRNEKALAKYLLSRNISYFLPMRQQTKTYNKRKVKSLLPLFSCYLFFCGSEKDRLDVLKTNRVANTITVKDRQRFVSELAQLNQAIQSGAQLAPNEFIKKGQRCIVTAGPLKNLQGIVINTKTSTKLILQIDMLGQAASVEINTDLIEPIE